MSSYCYKQHFTWYNIMFNAIFLNLDKMKTMRFKESPVVVQGDET